MNDLKQALNSELTERILPFHMENMRDPQGGFYGMIANDKTVDHSAPKGLVQCARLLWTYARAYRFYNEAAYLEMATTAHNGLNGRFHDPVHQGYFWTLTPDGEPLEKTKMIYGQAFAIYGLAEFYKATGNRTALNRAKDLFYLLEQHALDGEYGGYWDACTPDWQPDFNLAVDTVDFPVAKSMNTHLHVMEAYTNLLLAWDDAFLRERLRAIVNLHQQYIVDTARGHLRLHFDRQWQSLNDHFSYGHDIEASWLLWEAAEFLADPELCAAIRPTTMQLAEVALAEAVDSDGGLVEEGNPAGIIKRDKHWWPQAEALVGFFNAYQMNHDQRYLDAVFDVWDFIQQQIVDRDNGEWFWGIDANGARLPYEKAGMWKAPYHNGRACMELIRRIE